MYRSNMFRVVVFMVVMTFIPVITAIDHAAAEDTVKIGLVIPVSGAFEDTGRWSLANVKFAVDEQNARGGLLGKKIEIIIGDSELKPDVATQKAKKLILEDKVDFLGVAHASHVAIALNKVATEHKTLLINYATMGNIVQGKEFSRYAFRVCENAHNIPLPWLSSWPRSLTGGSTSFARTMPGAMTWPSPSRSR